MDSVTMFTEIDGHIVEVSFNSDGSIFIIGRDGDDVQFETKTITHNRMVVVRVKERN